MEAAYAEAYSQLAQNHWWWRARRFAITSELARLHDPAREARLIEVGCAGGANFEALSAFGQVEGLEPNFALLPKDPDLLGRIHSVPLDASFQPGQLYDRVLVLDVLEHVRDRAAFLRHAGRILHPEGRIIFTVPAHPSLWTQHDAINEHLLRFSRQALLDDLGSAGFRVERARFLFHSLVFPKAIVRLKERITRSSSPLPSTPWRPANALATALVRTEMALLGPLRLPFGTSLLATASLR